MTNPAVSIKSVSKAYGSFAAVGNFSLEVERGMIFALLGPNGAGKTTLIKILTTLMRPTSGDAFIEGYSVLGQAKQVRRLIGVVPQENNLDRYLTARENLVFHARMHGMSPHLYNQRIDRLLELIGLANRQNDFPDTFSGGMQRRLVVARALVHEPQVLFLDEPTTGLDPQSRRVLWDYIQTLRSRMTIFLTTHYMDEADTFCDRIMIMDHGKALVDGTASALKEALSRAHIYEVEFRNHSDHYEEILHSLSFVDSLERNGNIFRLALAGEESLKPLMDCLGSNDVRKICLQEPTLEDVFLELTGRTIRE
ncbi:ABC transporter, ATP-binding protein [Geotalea daltonii FRC-32]|uniref:ABC transporter, ATP-binding protein n=1 Tax=Geotalea daltonii (strain DSM 22248 / JCM 15807 / FRC-32) TaxID=316067 RepID=B9M7T1_GEODF|nr:daunorubicin resistance protein DrrA family ABC transporter ATP-binding protein [Geotalea daltonii]ACM18389.1 ABC transporter, ATP-binding protein [Geotalea daltonii FRC-32]